MGQIDLNINRQVRSVMVRRWIDLGRIGIHSASGKVTLRGSLNVLPGSKNDLDSPAVARIFQELRRIQNVARLTSQLENWVELEGVWKKIEITPAALPTSANLRSDRPQSFDLDES